MPEGAIYVGRPSKWGNPWVVGETVDGVYVLDHGHAVALFRSSIPIDLMEMAQVELQGHDLACWCPPREQCHADVLLEVANGSYMSKVS